MLEAAFAWLDERRRANTFSVEPIDLGDLEGWSFEPDTGDLAHRSGGFFRITGARAVNEQSSGHTWSQPIINQPEVGILGILAKEIDGVLCLLMQAKMEPGNINVVQLSPTVQATRSNYLRLHGGTPTRYLDRFRDAGRGRVLVDVLQSEHCTRFYRKRNRNMIVEIDDDPELGDDYRWLTLGQIHAMLRHDNLVNMDTRSVLSCLPLRGGPPPAIDDPFAAVMVASFAGEPDPIDVQHWLNQRKALATLSGSLIPLREVRGWRRGEREITHERGGHFAVMAAAVRATSREVPSWTQPLIRPLWPGVIAFLTSRLNGMAEVLIQARQEIGGRDHVELGPTVQCMPTGEGGPPYLDLIETAPASDIRYDVILSEEGGRFYHGENRYMIVEVDDDVRRAEPEPGYRWVTLGQLAALLPHSGYLTVESRSLIACAQALCH